MPWKSNTFNSIDDKHGSDHLLRVNMSTSIMAKLFSKPYLIVSVAMASSDGREGYYYRRILVKLFPTSLRKVSFNFCWKSVAVFNFCWKSVAVFNFLLKECRRFQLWWAKCRQHRSVPWSTHWCYCSNIPSLQLLLQHLLTIPDIQCCFCSSICYSVLQCCFCYIVCCRNQGRGSKQSLQFIQ